MVTWSEGYPLPMSPYSCESSLIILSRSTFAIIEAAETGGKRLSALCLEMIVQPGLEKDDTVSP